MTMISNLVTREEIRQVFGMKSASEAAADHEAWIAARSRVRPIVERLAAELTPLEMDALRVALQKR